VANYNILEYKHKKVISNSLNNFKDEDFKRQLMLCSKKSYFSVYDLTLFYKHIRNIKLCVNKLFKAHKEETRNSLKNSIIFLFGNYLENFIQSVISFYFYFPIENDAKQHILEEIVNEIYNY